MGLSQGLLGSAHELYSLQRIGRSAWICSGGGSGLGVAALRDDNEKRISNEKKWRFVLTRAIMACLVDA